MRLNHSFPLTIGSLIVLSAYGLAQQDTVWVRQLSGTGNGDDEVRAVCADAEGNVYLALVSRPDDSTAATTSAKYSPTGELLWTSRFEGNGYVVPVAIAVGADGSVHVACNSGFPGEEPDIVTLKLTSSGDTAWSRVFDGGEEDIAVRIMVDGAGGIYVAGMVVGFFTYEDLALLKYSPSGVREWVATADRDESEDLACDAVMDGDGNVYLVGTTDSESLPGYDFYVVKVHSGGVQLWSRSYQGTGPNDDSACAASMDSEGNLVVTGQTVKLGHVDSSGFLTVAFSPTGDTLWSGTVLGRANQRENGAVAVDADEQGNAVVGGMLDWAYCVVKYSGTGLELWRQTYSGPGGYDSLAAVAVTPAGEVYVTGASESERRSGRPLDATTLKLSAAGDSLWVRRWVALDSLWAVGTALVLADGGVSVAGSYRDNVKTGSHTNGVLLRYDGNGQAVWTRMLSSPGPSRDVAYDVEFDPDGNVVVAGQVDNTNASLDIAVAKYSLAGALLWSRTYGNVPHGEDRAVAVRTDDLGNVFVAGASEGEGTGLDFVTLKCSPLGDREWVRRYNGPADLRDEPAALALDRTGGVRVAGASYGQGTDLDYATVSYTATGEEFWVRRHNGSADSVDLVGGVVVDEQGATYVAGATSVPGRQYRATVVKYDSSGTEQWTLQLPDPDTAWDDFSGRTAGLGPDGSVYVGGKGAYKFLAARIDPEGETLWVRSADFDPGPGSDVSSSAVDGQGRCYVCGYIFDDYLTVAFGPDGTELWRDRYGEAGYGEWAYDVAVSDEDLVYVTGWARSQATTICYDSLGSRVWCDSLAGVVLYSTGRAVAIQNGRVAVAGNGYNPATGSNLLVACYAPRIGIREPGPLDPPMTDRWEATPNPFVCRTTLRSSLATPIPTVVRICTPAGQVLRSLTPEPARAAMFTWDGRDDAGQQVPAGVYLADISWQSGSTGACHRASRKLVKLD